MPRTFILTRLIRLMRMGLHFARAFVILATRYPRLPRAGRAAETRRWSLKLLEILAIERRISGHVPQHDLQNTLVVANHISWLDIIALESCTGTRFVAKQEIRHWPVIGWMVELGGTLFINRGNRRDASRVNQQMAEALANGDSLTVFPEGTTSSGHTLLPFKSSLFESALLAGCTVQPVTLRYRDEHGHITTAPSYAGETTLWESLTRMLRLRKMVVEIHYGTPLAAGGSPRPTRFELAEATRHEIAAGFNPVADRPNIQPKTPAGPPVEAP